MEPNNTTFRFITISLDGVLVNFAVRNETNKVMWMGDVIKQYVNSRTAKDPSFVPTIRDYIRFISTVCSASDPIVINDDNAEEESNTGSEGSCFASKPSMLELAMNLK